jgi:hypothetical protein
MNSTKVVPREIKRESGLEILLLSTKRTSQSGHSFDRGSDSSVVPFDMACADSIVLRVSDFRASYRVHNFAEGVALLAIAWG